MIASIDASASIALQPRHLEAAGEFADSVMACPLRPASVSGVPTTVLFDRHRSVQMRIELERHRQ